MTRIKNNIAFKATPAEMQKIKNACLNLSKTMAKSQTAQESFDVAEVGGKAYISASTHHGHTCFEVGMDNNKGSKAYTILTKNAKASIDDFLNSKKTLQHFAKIYDSLKEALIRASEREV